MKIRFHGVRGSIPTPLQSEDVYHKLRQALLYAAPKDIFNEKSVDQFLDSLPYSIKGTYGGNTPCLEIRSQDNDLLIVDAGTGLRVLGNRLLKEGFGEGKGEANMLFTHTHWDHIQGMPFFAPFHISGNVFHLHGIHDNLEERLRYQHHNHFSSVGFEEMASLRHFYQHKPNDVWELHDIRISQKALIHPDISYSYRFMEKGKVFIFCTDAEFKLDSEASYDINEYLSYFNEADVLVFDIQYSFEKQLQKIDWGHSSYKIAIDIASRAKVKKLVLYHYDALHDDENLETILSHALQDKKRSKDQIYNSLDIVLAREGMEIEI